VAEGLAKEFTFRRVNQCVGRQYLVQIGQRSQNSAG
jgi:hypothetical protein